MKSIFPPLFSRFAVTATVCALPASSLLAQAPATPAPPAAPAPAPAAKPAPPAAPAATPAATPAEKLKPLQNTDLMFVRNTAKSMNYLIQLSKAGMTGVTDPNYVRMRDTNAADLTKALGALTKIAEAHGEKLPTEVTGNDKVDLDRLAKVKPDKFLKDWIEAVFKEAKRLDRETETASKTLQDADLKTFMTNYGPGIHGVFASADTADKAAKKMK